jgi:hypothetical protein
VTTASSCSEAWEKLADKAENTFDIVLAEVSTAIRRMEASFGKDNTGWTFKLLEHPK